MQYIISNTFLALKVCFLKRISADVTCFNLIRIRVLLICPFLSVAQMPPKDKGKDATKQKSLMSFFQKASAGASSSQPPKQVARKSSAMSITQDASSPSFEPHTPENKRIDARAPDLSLVASSASSRGASTPPTSDPVDVDMVSVGEENYHRSVVGCTIYIIWERSQNE